MSRPSIARLSGSRRALGIAALASLVIWAGTVAPAPASPTQTLHRFRLSGGTGPVGPLIADASGSLYGVTNQGGAYGVGTVYKLVRTASGYQYILLHSFGPNEGGDPEGGLVMDAAGTLYGTTTAGGDIPSGSYGTVFKMTPSGSSYTFSSLYTFRGPEHGDGAIPFEPVTIAPGGVLYGTTIAGGANIACADGEAGCGVVFRLTPSGSSYQETILHVFQGGHDGAEPVGSLALDRRGTLYGSTYLGGEGCDKVGCGTIFRVDTGSKQRETTIYKFGGLERHDGASPVGPLAIGSDGDVFGATIYGGPRGACKTGCGTVFRLSSRGSSKYFENTLYAFTDGPDGAGPLSGIVLDAHNDLFGTTSYGGGSSKCDGGCGTVFELVRRGNAYGLKVLHTFTGGRDGWFSQYDPLAIDSAGNIFGATYYGGYSGRNCLWTGCGTIFELPGAAST
jgi:uncharacterized repeat protein (TIGR03803 family)